MEPNLVLDWEGNPAGKLLREVNTPDGDLLFIAREERLGGGIIPVPARSADKPDDAWHLAYSELSLREAPPYSEHVDLHAYFAFWKRLGTADFNRSMGQYTPSGSGPVHSDVTVLDEPLREAVHAALRSAASQGVNAHLIQLGVKHGTVLLEGFQNDAPGRLAAAEAAASVPGVKEIINMLVIRALV